MGNNTLIYFMGILSGFLPVISILGVLIFGIIQIVLTIRVKKLKEIKKKDKLESKKKINLIILIIFAILLGISLLIIPYINAIIRINMGF